MNETMSRIRVLQRKWKNSIRLHEGPQMAPSAEEAAYVECAPSDDEMRQVQISHLGRRVEYQFRMVPGAREAARIRDAFSSGTMLRVRELQREGRRPNVNLPSKVKPTRAPAEKPIRTKASKGNMRTFWGGCKKWGKKLRSVARDLVLLKEGYALLEDVLKAFGLAI